MEAYAKGLPIKSATLSGGANIAPQTKKLLAGVDLIIATPGRLLDHLKLKNVGLSKIEYLVLDEADTMLDMGFVRDIEALLQRIPAKRQARWQTSPIEPDAAVFSQPVGRK